MIFPTRFIKCHIFVLFPASCPTGWLKLHNACYKVHDKPVSWFEARKVCLEGGSDLLTLKTKPEEASIRSYLESKNSHYYYYWLGE
jgi:hypothetical protein